jgi:hypothetical protein
VALVPRDLDRSPSAVDRVPVSRLGDELQAEAEHAEHAGTDDVADEEHERRAEERARQKGWDKRLDDVEAPPADQ